MINDLPKIAKHCILIRYEDLLTDFETTMSKLRSKGLMVKSDVSFPVNSTNYKNKKNKKYIPNKKRLIPRNKIIKNPNLRPQYEDYLGYNIKT
jgi:hypothetical protein